MEKKNREKAYRLYKDGEVSVSSKEEAQKVIAEARSMDREYSNGQAQYTYIQVFKDVYTVKQF